MKISEAFKALGDQHLEEQNLLSKGLSIGVSNIKDYFRERSVKKEEAMKAMQAELLAKKLEARIAPKVKKKKPQIKI